MITFEEYLMQKKIDSNAFRNGEPTQWQEFAHHFEQVHPDSFTAQKLFLINAIRRKFSLKEVPAEEKAVLKAKPKVRVPVKKNPES